MYNLDAWMAQDFMRRQMSVTRKPESIRSTAENIVEMVDWVVTALGAIGLVEEVGEAMDYGVSILDHMQNPEAGILVGLIFSKLYRTFVAGTIGTAVLRGGMRQLDREMQSTLSPGMRAFSRGVRMFSHDVLWATVGAVTPLILERLAGM